MGWHRTIADTFVAQVNARKIRDSAPQELFPKATGTQALGRALSLLFRIATEGHEGMRLSELATRTQLDSATARRLLLCLKTHGFVEQDPLSRRYFLGLDFFNLAAAASNRFDLSSTIRGSLARLSHETSETSAFFIRSGYEIVCTDLIKTAGYAASADAIDIGSRRAIGAGAFGIAVLSSFNRDEAEQIAIHNLRHLSRVPEDGAREIGNRIRQTQQNGFAQDTDPHTGAASLAVAILGRSGKPESVIGLSHIRSGRKQRIDTLARALIGETRHIEDALWRIPVVQSATLETVRSGLSTAY